MRPGIRSRSARARAGRFEIDLPLEDFPRLKNRFPNSPLGHEIVYIWIQTLKEDAGLEIVHMELLQ